MKVGIPYWLNELELEKEMGVQDALEDELHGGRWYCNKCGIPHYPKNGIETKCIECGSELEKY